MKVKKKLLLSVLEILQEYQSSGLTPERCMELAEAEREGRLIVLPDLSRLAEIAAEAVRNNTYGGVGHD